MYQITYEWNKTDKANYISAFYLENLYVSSWFKLFQKGGEYLNFDVYQVMMFHNVCVGLLYEIYIYNRHFKDILNLTVGILHKGRFLRWAFFEIGVVWDRRCLRWALSEMGVF